MFTIQIPPSCPTKDEGVFEGAAQTVDRIALSIIASDLKNRTRKESEICTER